MENNNFFSSVEGNKCPSQSSHVIRVDILFNLFMEIQYSFSSYIIRLICPDLDLMNSVLV